MTRPQWRVPSPYGYAAAIDSMGSVSAPLLAATSAALLALVLSADSIRWPNLALVLLSAATLAFVSAVQLTFWAKRFVVTPSDLAEWWPTLDVTKDPEIAWEQRFHMKRHLVWAARAKRAYNAGVLSLLASLPVMLVPTCCTEGLRWVAVGLAGLGFLGEATWIALASYRPALFDRVNQESSEG